MLAAALWPATLWAGPPYFTDDPVPTDERHFEIYAFADGLRNSGGTSSDLGIDFNYGGARDLQLTAVFPVNNEHPRGAGSTTGLGNIELAAKYRFLHQQDGGWEVAVFPRVFLASASSNVGEQHTAVQLPIWFGRDWAQWSTFGGGGCVLNHGGGARDYCFAGWVLAKQVLPALQLGAELYYQSADAADARDKSFAGAGVRYDLNDHLHLLAYASGGLQNAPSEHQYSWYAAVLFTY
jgi:outer membrane putative beta-barrel porin/alpha-amylase